MGIHILFADDSATIRKVVELAFDNNDITVTTVSDGFEVLELLESSLPDIVVADIDMPGFNGIEVCRHIKDNEELQAIPVLLLRNQSDDFDDAALQELKADGCITKPFKSEELIKKVREVLGLPESYNVGDESILEEESVLEDIESELFAEVAESSDEELLPLTHDVELMNPEPQFSSAQTVVEVLSNEKSVKEEEPNLSGIMTEQDIQESKEEIVKRNSELDDFFGNDDDIDWEDAEGVGTILGDSPNDLFKNVTPKRGIENEVEKKELAGELPPIIIPEEKLEHIIQSVLEKVATDINEQVVGDQLKKFLEDLAPQINSSIERIIWEIVPDLAESLIKKEIEKIKNG